jgi:hypothetical protein
MKFFITRFLVFGLALSSFSFALLPEKQLQDSLDAKLESIESRRGLEFGGTVRSIMLRSAFSSKQNKDIDAYDRSPDVERSNFSQFDLNIGVRPFDWVRANAVLRMGANYQDYFQSIKTVFTVPWISMEGQVSDWLFWTVGDFRSELSPLSVYSPDVEVLYEPEIYARTRYMARDQVFLKGNARNLQGANLQARLNFGETIGELRLEGIFSRLRRTEVLDFGGYVGNILPNETGGISAKDTNTLGASQASGMDKLLYMGNLEWLPFSKNLLLGVTPIFIKDLKTSTTTVNRYHYDANGAPIRNPTGNRAVIRFTDPVNPGVLGPENTQVITARFGADVASFLNNENLIANLVGEYAMSKDDYYYEGLYNHLTGDYDGVKDTVLEGKAILAQLVLGWQVKDSWVARINANYIMNDSAWYNPLAQSPAFFARRVANSDKDGDLLKMGPWSPFYTTFDALYHFVPKFMPVDKKLSTGGLQDNKDYLPTKSYAIAPFPKNSYNTGVYTRDELALLQQLADPVLQSALPNGLATANRVGPVANLTVGFGKNNEIEAQGVFTMLEENQALNGSLGKAKFMEFGGGGSIDIGSLVWGLPLVISGSYKNSKSEFGDIDFTSDFINAGFYAKFYKRFGVSAGFQQINTEAKYSELPTKSWFLSKGDQKQWMAGLDYTLVKNAWVALNFGQIIVKNTYKADDPANATGLLPVYIEESLRNRIIEPKADNSIEHSFQQNLVEASINVSF